MSLIDHSSGLKMSMFIPKCLFPLSFYRHCSQFLFLPFLSQRKQVLSFESILCHKTRSILKKGYDHIISLRQEMQDLEWRKIRSSQPPLQLQRTKKAESRLQCGNLTCWGLHPGTGLPPSTSKKDSTPSTFSHSS